MAKINKDTFDFMGEEFQIRLIYQILTDKQFGESIVDIIDPNYFNAHPLKLIINGIKESYVDYNNLPDIGSLEFRLRNTSVSELEHDFITSFLEKIKNANANDALEVQKLGMQFCKLKELKKAVHLIQKIIDDGDINRQQECEDILRKASEHGDNKDTTSNIFDDIDLVLEEDYRKPIPTGISGLDDIMDGGLSRGELALILAPYGVGKTTIITKIANTAKNLGLNVLQIFFEDSVKVIQRKHLSCWSGIELNELSNHKDEIIHLIKEKQNEAGELRFHKFPSAGTNMGAIHKFVRKQIAQGFRPDIILLDYIDCVEPTKYVEDNNVGEGRVMREFENMLVEFNIAGWTAVQGNRCVSLETDVEILRLGKTKIKNVILGDEILTHEGYKKITEVFPIQKQAIYKIKTKSGKEIKVSAKHEFPVKYGKLKSISTGLKIGDKLLTKKM